MISVSVADDFLSAHVRPEDLGHGDGTVLVLVVLQDRDDGPGECETGSVQRVDEFALEVRFRTVFDLGPACLEIREVGARRCFQPCTSCILSSTCAASAS